MKSQRKSTHEKILLPGLLMISILLFTGCGQGAGNTQGEQSAQDSQSMQEDPAEKEGQFVQREQNMQADREQSAIAEHEYIYEKVESKEEEMDEMESLAGKKLSIMGDSLSTFDGWIPPEYVVFYPFNGDVASVEETWWMSLISDTGMELCGNGSSSGSTCVGDSTAIDNPEYGCSGYRIQGLTGDHGEYPDIILVYMGTNDLLKGAPLGGNDGTESVGEGMITDFSDAYCLILDKLASAYPAAQIICCGLPQIGDWGTDQPFVTFENNLGLTAADYNQCIEQVAEAKGCPYINLYDCGIVPENMHEFVTDGVHFNPDGMKLVKESIEAGLNNYFPAS